MTKWVVALSGLFLGICASSCQRSAEDGRQRELVSVLTRADADALVSRPGLLAAKYRVMSERPYAFYRGSMPLFLHDAGRGAFPTSRFDAPVFPFSPGDNHPENFGVLAGSDGELSLEPNDFDSADRVPYLLDLRRLVVGILVAAADSNADDPAARGEAVAAWSELAIAASLGYAEEIDQASDDGTSEVMGDGGDSEVLTDVFERGARDLAERPELSDLTRLEGTRRTLQRGAYDPEDPRALLLDIPEEVWRELPGVLDRYRDTLQSPPPDDFFQLLDAARLLGSGVASYPRIRVLLLVRGPTDDPSDDELLELKELANLHGIVAAPAPVQEDLALRNEAARSLAWSRRDADPLWGTSELLGLPIQIRAEREGFKSVRVKRLSGDRGTPGALADLGRALGRRLARIHLASEQVRPGTVSGLRAAVGADREAFARDLSESAIPYARQVLADYESFVDVLETSGPLLGARPTSGEPLPPVLAALVADPPIDWSE